MPVQLRPLHPNDAAVSVHWRNDPEIRNNILGYRGAVTEATERQWIEQILADDTRKRIVFSVEDMTDGALVGYIYLDDIDWINHVAWVGILLGDKSRHRRGLGRSACKQLFEIAKNEFSLRKLLVKIVDFNARSRLFFNALGFMPEGLLKKHISMDGHYYDLHILSKFL